MKPWNVLRESDPEVFGFLEDELARQRDGIELIASENFASIPVIASMANPLANKYAEGLPAKRYYGGCEVVDQVETLAIDRATSLFDCAFANVQPHSGAQANAAVFLALAEPGATILGMDLSHGGHLTHGAAVNFSGRLYTAHHYQLDSQTERLDYEAIAERARALRPRIIIAGASAYPRKIDFARFRQIADDVDAYLVVDMAHIAGLVAAGLHPSPLPHAHVVTTTTHKTLRGPRGGLMLWNDPKLTARLNKGVFPGTQGGPLEHIIAAKAVCFAEAKRESFRVYSQATIDNSQALAEALIAHDFRLVSGGTDNHLVLVDLSHRQLTGKQMENALGAAGLTVNKNTVPKETLSPFVTSGIRLGTPAVTSRGMTPMEMKQIAQWIDQVARDPESQANLSRVHDQVRALCGRFPLYPEWT